MKIEEAIVYCLATSNRGMRTEQIADMINRQRLHLRKDGLPYKTHFGAFICRGGKKSGFSGYYFHIGTGSGEEYPCRSFLAVGNYYMEPKVLKIVREDIELGGGDFDRIIKRLHPSLSLDQDQKLKRAPLEFNADGPYIDNINAFLLGYV